MKPLPDILKSKRLVIVAVVLACDVAASQAATDADPRLKAFATQKRQQTEELATKLHLDVPPEAREFFHAAEAGDWIAVSNSFERMWPQPVTNGPLRGLRNVLYVPIHETFWAYAEFGRWEPTMLQKFTDGVLKSIPAGSIYFGGTDAGRFVVTAVRDVAKSPDIFIVTQNLIGVDGHYTDYLRLLYGGRIWVPGEKDIQQAFQQSAEDVKSLNGIMGIIGKLTKMMFDNNKDKHAFYIEESYVIPWMYPYLEPDGLIMKLNKEPLTQLDPAVVAGDRKFWDALTKELLADKRFLGNDWGRNAYAKLRTSIGGVYEYRGLTNEAEVVFQQARELGPTSPEANFRLAHLYTDNRRFDDAVAVLEQMQSRLGATDPVREHVTQAIAQIRGQKKLQADDQKHRGNP